MKIRMLPVLSLALGFALACSGGTPETTAPPPPPPAADGKIGVPECDDYITKMEACIASADPATKGAMESGFKATRDAWAQAAAIPQTRGTLASSCSVMLASIPANCGAGAAAGTPLVPTDGVGAIPGTPGTPGTPGASGTPGTPGTAAVVTPTTTTTTTTTVVTTTDEKAAEPPKKASETGARAPSRDNRPAADFGRTRDGSGSGSGTKRDGDKKDDGRSQSGGMGKSR